MTEAHAELLQHAAVIVGAFGLAIVVIRLNLAALYRAERSMRLRDMLDDEVTVRRQPVFRPGLIDDD
jgi:uncharacterized membrane protein